MKDLTRNFALLAMALLLTLPVAVPAAAAVNSPFDVDGPASAIGADEDEGWWWGDDEEGESDGWGDDEEESTTDDWTDWEDDEEGGSDGWGDDGEEEPDWSDWGDDGDEGSDWDDGDSTDSGSTGNGWETEWGDDDDDDDDWDDGEWGDDDDDFEFEPDCVAGKPRKRSEAHRSCSGEKDSPCNIWNPTRSDSCAAIENRLDGVEVSYEYFGQTDCRTSKRKKDVDMIVIHNGDSARGNTRTWQCRRAAAHYTVDRDGTIYQHVGEELVAWHAKKANPSSIGIELQILRGYGSSCNSLRGKKLRALAKKQGVEPADIITELCAPTDEQYDALNDLISDIRSRHSIDEVVGHCEVDPPGGHADPRAFDWERIGMSNEDKRELVDNNETACTWYHLF